jgi:hypothetical protein
MSVQGFSKLCHQLNPLLLSKVKEAWLTVVQQGEAGQQVSWKRNDIHATFM